MRGRSAAEKHARLGEELHWAASNGRLAEALRFLGQIRPADWQTATDENWFCDYSDPSEPDDPAHSGYRVFDQ